MVDESLTQELLELESRLNPQRVLPESLELIRDGTFKVNGLDLSTLTSLDPGSLVLCERCHLLYDSGFGKRDFFYVGNKGPYCGPCSIVIAREILNQG